MTKKTLGAISIELQQSDSGLINPQEIQKAQEKEYIDNLIWAVKHAQKKIDCSTIEGHDICKDRVPYEKDFYVVVLLKKEKLLENVLRNYFVTTRDCPTPHFDQTVYKYNHEKEDVEFLWVVPDRDTCEILRDNALEVAPEERSLLQFVLDYYNGDLFRLAKKLNGESMHVGVALEGR